MSLLIYIYIYIVNVGSKRPRTKTAAEIVRGKYNTFIFYNNFEFTNYI